jgi:hypothetical protein
MYAGKRFTSLSMSACDRHSRITAPVSRLTLRLFAKCRRALSNRLRSVPVKCVSFAAKMRASVCNIGYLIAAYLITIPLVARLEVVAYFTRLNVDDVCHDFLLPALVRYARFAISSCAYSFTPRLHALRAGSFSIACLNSLMVFIVISPSILLVLLAPASGHLHPLKAESGYNYFIDCA